MVFWTKNVPTAGQLLGLTVPVDTPTCPSYTVMAMVMVMKEEETEWKDEEEEEEGEGGRKRRGRRRRKRNRFLVTQHQLRQVLPIDYVN